MNAVVAVYEGFVGADPTKHVLKELCLYGEEEGLLTHVLFRPPYKWLYQTPPQQVTNQWLTNNRHGLLWNSGRCTFTYRLGKFIMAGLEHRPVYTKGWQSVQQLKKLLSTDNIFNLEEYGCKTPILKLTPTSNPCTYHTVSCANVMCAREKAKVLLEWINVNL